MLDTTIINDLLDTIDFRKDTGKEECAVIFSRSIPQENPGDRTTVYRIMEIPNRHSDADNHFRIMQSDLSRIQQGDETLEAVVHTHTRPGEAEPSYEDVKGLPDSVLGLVVHPRTDSWTLYNNKVGVIAFRDGKKK